MKHIKVKVFPGSSKALIEPAGEDRLVAYLRAEPKNNEANKQLLTLLASHFGIPKINLRIISGHKKFKKILEIKDL